MQDASVTSLTLSGAANSGVSVGASLMGGQSGWGWRAGYIAD